MHAQLLARYRALQQDADFALWRARETSLEVRRLYAGNLAGTAEPPPPELMGQLVELERDAETKYMALRGFLREELERLATQESAPAPRP